ncbi:hypothetical protein N7444_010067 [Penicillium canescens]|nr:hypothetical protein N7444_010067 [Penicillium canescens]
MSLKFEANKTCAERQGKYINSTNLSALWKEYGELSGASAVVLLAHSIGAMMATITAGSYTGTEGYSLAGLITSGIGVSHGNFDPVMKDQMMLKIPNMSLADPEVTKHSASLNKPVPVGEIMEINTTWLRDWHRHSHQVKVPLKYGVSDFDEL